MSEENQYLQEAAYLAEHFTDMITEREALKKRLAGSWVYTEDMAIAELTSVTVSYEGERVQSSNISNPTERVALKLTDSFMKRKQAEMDRERVACEQELEYITWKLLMIKTVVSERLKKTERLVFQCLYLQHMTFKETEQWILKKTGEKLVNRNIVSIKKRIWENLNSELKLFIGMNPDSRFPQTLVDEAKATQEDGVL